jgi:hypothetical protein
MNHVCLLSLCVLLLFLFTRAEDTRDARPCSEDSLLVECQFAPDRNRCCAEHTILRSMLHESVRFFEAMNFTWHIADGSLLGPWRSNGVLPAVPWEKDGDLNIVVDGYFRSRSAVHKFRSRLRAFDDSSQRFRLAECDRNPHDDTCWTAWKVVEVSPTAGVRRMTLDWFILFRPRAGLLPNDAFVYTNAYWSQFRYPASLILPVRRCPFKVYGLSVNCPADSDGYLRFLYGDYRKISATTDFWNVTDCRQVTCASGPQSQRQRFPFVNFEQCSLDRDQWCEFPQVLVHCSQVWRSSFNFSLCNNHHRLTSPL